MNPDKNSNSFLGYVPDPTRYEYSDNSPYEVQSIVSSLVSPYSRVLEIGCGTGALGKSLLLSKNIIYEGIEPSLERSKLARTKGLTVHNSYLTNELIGKLGKYDSVILADVIEHIPDPSELLDLTKPLLNADGVLILSVPNVAHWSMRLSLLLGKFEYSQTGILDATHLRWFTKSSLIKYVENCGFSVERVEVSSGYSLDAYRSFRRIFGHLLPLAWARFLLFRLCVFWPEFFACQFVCLCRVKKC